MNPEPVGEARLESLRPFWGPLEIAGLIAVLAPLVISMSSSSLHRENGHVEFVFRDWIAVGGGALGILCGLGAAARFKGTMPTKRPLRIGVVLLLLGLGTFQLLRGFGVTSSPPAVASVDRLEDPLMRDMMKEAAAKQAADRPVSTSTDAAAAALTTPPMDLSTPAATAFATWQRGKAAEFLAATTASFQKKFSNDDVQMMMARIKAATGACGPLLTPITYELKDDTWTATAPIKCDAAPLKVAVAFEIDQAVPKVSALNFTNPAAHMDQADAAKLAGRTAEDLLAADGARLAEDFDARVNAKFAQGESLADQVRKIVVAAGKRGTLKQTSTSSKGDESHDFAFDVPGAKHHLTITLSVGYFIAGWFVTDFNIGPADEAPKK